MVAPRPDTRFLCASTLTTDLSQRETNLTSSSTAAYETNSARTTFDPTTSGRSIEVSIELDTSVSGTVLHIGSSATVNTAVIDVDSGDVTFGVGPDYIATITAPNVDGTAKTYIIGFASYANPLTTGASDAVRSECWVYDVDGDALAFEVVDHATGSPSGTMSFVVGGLWSGSVGDLVDATINGARVSARFHTRSESREHWVAQTSSPTVTGVSAVELQLPPADTCVAGAVVGQQIQHAATSLDSGRSRHRLAGPVLSLITSPLVIYQSSLVETVSQTWVRDNGDGFSTPLGLVWRRRVPQSIERVLPRVWLLATNTEAEAVSVSMRLYCASEPPAQALVWNVVEWTKTTDDGENPPPPEQLDSLAVLRDHGGFSYFWVGFSVTEATPLATLFALLGITLTCFTRPTLGGDPPNLWGP